MRRLTCAKPISTAKLCDVGPDGIISFNSVQLASDSGNAVALVFFLFDLLYLDGEDLREHPLINLKERLSARVRDLFQVARSVACVEPG